MNAEPAPHGMVATRTAPHPRTASPDTLGRLRRLLCAILAFGIAGTIVELFLLGHVEDLAQQVPLIAIAIATVAGLAAVIVRGPATLQFFRITMAGFTAVGILGVWLHYRGNVEFELEMVPSLHGFELFREALTGATPTLAPGLMVQLGLLGLTCTYGLGSRRDREREDT